MEYTVVTGAAGFIGIRIAQSLKEKGVEAVLVDDKAHFGIRPEHKNLAQGLEVDYRDFFNWAKSKKLAAIVHMGACSDTTETNKAYLDEVNVGYSQKLWDLACKLSIPFIYASSAATYGDGALGYSDDESKIAGLRPLNLYGQSKQDFDLWALAQEKLGHHPPRWSGFKFFNVYGFGERHKGKMASVVLHAFDQIKESSQMKLFKSHKAGIKDGEQKRDFVFIDDVVSVIDFALSGEIKRGIYNLGSGKARSFLDLAHAVFQEMGVAPKVNFIDTPVSIRDRYQYFTEGPLGKLRNQGYTKTFATLESGIKKYVGELRKFSNGK